MKRIISAILILTVMMSIFSSLTLSVNAASTIQNVYVNGVALEFSDAERPFIQSDRTMVPLRAIAEALGATVYWFNDEKKIQIVRYDTTLRLIIGLPSLDIYKIENSDQTKVDTVQLDAPAFQGDISRDYRTFVPLRAISEAFGADVNAAFVDNDETAVDRPMNIYIVDTYDETNENIVSIANLYDNTDIDAETLIATTGIISKLDTTYYLQDENESYKMITLTDIPDTEDFWTQQLGVADNNPVGTKIRITGMVSYNDGQYSMPLRRGSTGIRTIQFADGTKPVNATIINTEPVTTTNDTSDSSTDENGVSLSVTDEDLFAE